MNFSLLDSLLGEKRYYDYNAGQLNFICQEIDRLRRSYHGDFVPSPSDGPLGYWNCPSAGVYHIAVKPSVKACLIEQKFGVALPGDFIEFYTHYAEALLLGRNPILIMRPEQIIEVSDELRDAHNAPSNLPRHVIRFAWLGADEYFLMRYVTNEKDWEILLSSYSQSSDEELQSGSSWGIRCDNSFSNWFQRIINTDGAPLDGNELHEEGRFPANRVYA